MRVNPEPDNLYSAFGSNSSEIHRIKQIIKKNVGKSIELRSNCGTNSEKISHGKITDAFENLFIVKLDSGVNKSITYVDVYIRNKLKYDFKFSSGDHL